MPTVRSTNKGPRIRGGGMGRRAHADTQNKDAQRLRKQRLAARVKQWLYNDGKTIGETITLAGGERARQFVLDVIYYREHRDAEPETIDDLGAFT